MIYFLILRPWQAVQDRFFFLSQEWKLSGNVSRKWRSAEKLYTYLELSIKCMVKDSLWWRNLSHLHVKQSLSVCKLHGLWTLCNWFYIKTRKRTYLRYYSLMRRFCFSYYIKKTFLMCIILWNDSRKLKITRKMKYIYIFLMCIIL